MTIKTAGGATVSFQAADELVEDFDEWVDASEYDNRSEALRALMQEASGSTPDSGTPLVPPSEERLSTAYKRLCSYAGQNGYVRDEAAKTGLASVLNLSKSEIGPVVMKPLRERGYVKQQSNVYGARSWKLVGWNDD